LARRYDHLLKHLPLQLPTVHPEIARVHIYVVRLRREATALTHRQVYDQLPSAALA